jgi:hypothetical protein
MKARSLPYFYLTDYREFDKAINGNMRHRKNSQTESNHTRLKLLRSTYLLQR